MKQKIFTIPVLLLVLSAFGFSFAMVNTDVNLANLSPPTSFATDELAAQGSGAVVPQMENDATIVNSKNTWAIAGTPMKMKSAVDMMNACTVKKVLVYCQTEVRRLAPFSDVTKVAGHDETLLIPVEVYTIISGAQDHASPANFEMGDNSGLINHANYVESPGMQNTAENSEVALVACPFVISFADFDRAINPATNTNSPIAILVRDAWMIDDVISDLRPTPEVVLLMRHNSIIIGMINSPIESDAENDRTVDYGAGAQTLQPQAQEAWNCLATTTGSKHQNLITA